MRHFILIILWATWIAPCGASLQAESLYVGGSIDFLPVHEAYQPTVFVQSDDQILMNWDIADGYYLYGDQFEFKLSTHNAPIDIQLEQSPGTIAYDDYFEKEVEKHYEFTTQHIQLLNFSGESATLAIRFQGCADAGLCYPPEHLYYRINFPQQIVESLHSHEAITEVDEPLSAPTDGTSFPLMFFFALLGGLILNLMPCVFPVLSIKLLSFVQANQSTARIKAHCWFYTFGVLTTFVSTALILILLRQSGAAIGWGFQLQSPIFIGLLALLFLILALSLSDIITLGSRFMGVGQQLTHGQHYRNSFFTGVLAVVVASPCSVPFMGAAIGYALTQPVYAALFIFAGLGLGLALPFLLFAYVPRLMRHLPKPGPWMQRLKHWFALPLYLTVIWLVWVLAHQLSTEHSSLAQHVNAKAFSRATLDQHLSKGEAVFVNLTADWCITCLFNERTSLATTEVQQAFQQHNVQYLVGDWTDKNSEITEFLEEHQRAGVPLYLYYSPYGEVTVLPQLLTRDIIINAISQPSPN